MAIRAETFSPEAAVAAIMFLADRATPNMYDILKMLYVADKRHLNDTGRFMFGDEHCAMEKGALPSRAYDLIKYARGEKDDHYGYPGVRSMIRVDDHKIRLLQKVPDDYLSASALNHLQSVVDEHRRALSSKWHWYRAAHDDAWKAAWERRGDNRSEAITPQDIAQCALRNERLLRYLND